MMRGQGAGRQKREKTREEGEDGGCGEDSGFISEID